MHDDETVSAITDSNFAVSPSTPERRSLADDLDSEAVSESPTVTEFWCCCWKVRTIGPEPR